MSDLRISQVLALTDAELKKTWEISKSPMKADQVGKSTPHARTPEKRAQSERVEEVRRDLFNRPSTSGLSTNQPSTSQEVSQLPVSRLSLNQASTSRQSQSKTAQKRSIIVDVTVHAEKKTKLQEDVQAFKNCFNQTFSADNFPEIDSSDSSE